MTNIWCFPTLLCVCNFLANSFRKNMRKHLSTPTMCSVACWVGQRYGNDVNKVWWTRKSRQIFAQYSVIKWRTSTHAAVLQRLVTVDLILTSWQKNVIRQKCSMECRQKTKPKKKKKEAKKWKFAGSRSIKQSQINMCGAWRSSISFSCVVHHKIHRFENIYQNNEKRFIIKLWNELYVANVECAADSSSHTHQSIPIEKTTSTIITVKRSLPNARIHSNFVFATSSRFYAAAFPIDNEEGDTQYKFRWKHTVNPSNSNDLNRRI